MKYIIFFLTVTFFTPLSLAWSQGEGSTADLSVMQKAGLSPESLGRYLTQNLDADRRAPALSPQLLASLGRYGGDDLARAYLDFDQATLAQSTREFSPEVLNQFLAQEMPPTELAAILRREAAAKSSSGSGNLMPPPLPPTVTSTQTTEKMEDAPIVPPVAPKAPTAPVRVQYQSETPKRSINPAPAYRGEQYLRRGEPADPSMRIMSTDEPFPTRQEPASGNWLGVTEHEYPDGRRVERHSVGERGRAGQEVLRRPSGREVHRYYSGDPDRPPFGEDPAQEWENKEDLHIIFNGDSYRR